MKKITFEFQNKLPEDNGKVMIETDCDSSNIVEHIRLFRSLLYTLGFMESTITKHLGEE
jgi:hypothetical protein